MKTGKSIIDNWHKHSKTAWFAVEDREYLEERIDAALEEARLAGELMGWKNAKKMVDAMLGDFKK